MVKRKAASNKATKSKMAKRSKSNGTQPTPDLFGVPGEVRNRIYRAALLDNCVQVTRQTREEPALLRTCRQIRHEARSIFQQENKFILTVHDFEAPTTPHWIWYSKVPHENIYVTFCGRPIYGNLRVWLQHYYEGRAKWMEGVSTGDGQTHWVLNRLFRIVDTLKDLTWDTVDAVLWDAKAITWSPVEDMWVELDSDGDEINTEDVY